MGGVLLRMVWWVFTEDLLNHDLVRGNSKGPGSIDAVEFHLLKEDSTIYFIM